MRPAHKLTCSQCGGNGKYPNHCPECGRKVAYLPQAASIEQRFWRKVRKGPGCWEWLGAHTGIGCPRFSVRGVCTLANRFVYEMTKGPIPPGMVTMHSCDNQLCVNPDHINLGTYSENLADMVKKGRCPVAKLKPADITEIRRQWKGGEPVEVLSRRYGVGVGTIRRAATGVTWRLVV